MTAETEVLIVGAGPTGLSLAIECARHGVAFRIVDRAPAPSGDSKALVLWSAAQEAFEAMGVLDALRERAFHPAGLRILRRGNTLLHIPAGAHVDSPFPTPILLPQSETERILRERLEGLGHRVERALECVGIQEDTSGVTVSLQGPEASPQEIRCGYVVGCDGAHSAVRHAVGGKFEGRAHPQCFILCDAEVFSPEPLPAEILIHVSPRGTLSLLPIRGRVWRVISAREEAAGTAPPTLAEMQEHINERTSGGIRLSNAQWLSCLRLSERKVGRFRHGRTLLAGDAAHLHTPVGGQGLNAGVQDAFNLGWKLGLILRKGANPDALLESYDAERLAAAAQIIFGSALRARLTRFAGGALAALRDLATTTLGRSKRLQQKIARDLAGTAMTLPSGPAVATDASWGEDWRSRGFPPGSRVRDVPAWVEDAPLSLLRELQSTSDFTLLLFSGRKPNYRDAELLEGLRFEAAGFSSFLTASAIWRGDRKPDDSWLLDPEGAAHTKFGCELPSAYLIRPDGVVAIRVQPAHFQPIAAFLSRIREATKQPS